MERRFRNELKFFINSTQKEIIKNRLSAFMKSDDHAIDGKYVIRSLYFDSYMNTCFYDNENGYDPREKFRIRLYNSSLDFIALECKRKERGLTSKESALLSVDLCRKLMKASIVTEDNPIMKKLSVNMMVNKYSPKVIVEYDRIPFTYKDGNVRITFDENVRSSYNVDSFLCERINSRLILPYGLLIMEVKYDSILPDFIKDCLNVDNLIQTPFSKYYLCRKYNERGLI